MLGIAGSLPTSSVAPLALKHKRSWIEHVTGSDGKRKRRPIQVPQTAEEDMKDFNRLFPTGSHMQYVWVTTSDLYKPGAVYHYSKKCPDPTSRRSRRISLPEMVDVKCIPCAECYPVGYVSVGSVSPVHINFT